MQKGRTVWEVVSWRFGLALLACLAASTGVSADAQELEPGAYAVGPVGTNVLVIANTFSAGDLAFDPSGPIEDARARINALSAGFGRAINVAGRSAQLSIGVPIVAGHIEGLYLGEHADVSRYGLGDPRVRLGINLYGAPAMDLRTFATFRPPRLIGASVTVSLPIGRYTTDRLINIGNNRWAVRPQAGFVQDLGRWSVEILGGVWIFGTNDEFYNGGVRTQDPIGSIQVHVDYEVRPRWLVSGNVNYYSGGRTTVNGAEQFDLQKNSRFGGTLVHPLPGGRTIRLAVSQGAYTTIGADFTSLSFSFQQAWSGRRP